MIKQLTITKSNKEVEITLGQGFLQKDHTFKHNNLITGLKAIAELLGVMDKGTFVIYERRKL